MGLLGVLNSAYSISNTSNGAFNNVAEPLNTNNATPNRLPSPAASRRGRGNQRSLGYSYSNAFFNLNAQHIISSDEYSDLANYKTPSLLSRRMTQLTGSLSLGSYGTVGSGYFDVRDALGEQTRLINISYSTSLLRNSNFIAH